MKVCAVVPTFDNPRTIEQVVSDVRKHVEDVIVVDDGSGPEARRIAEELRERGLAHVVLRPRNGGKGAAVKSGLAEARERGYSHALQIDADGQHDPDDVPKLLRESEADPEALVLGQPTFDETAPLSRRIGRQVSVFWCAIETFSRRVGDPLCGFRVYPVGAALSVNARGDAMDFDPEIAVRLVWAGHAVRHVKTRVRYFDGGVSHFRVGRDTWLISRMHARLCLTGIARVFRLAR